MWDWHPRPSGRDARHLRPGAFAACLVPADRRDVSPLPGQRLGGLEAQPAAGAGDNHHPVADGPVGGASCGSALKDEVPTCIGTSFLREVVALPDAASSGTPDPDGRSPAVAGLRARGRVVVDEQQPVGVVEAGGAERDVAGDQVGGPQSSSSSPRPPRLWPRKALSPGQRMDSLPLGCPSTHASGGRHRWARWPQPSGGCTRCHRHDRGPRHPRPRRPDFVSDQGGEGDRPRCPARALRFAAAHSSRVF